MTRMYRCGSFGELKSMLRRHAKSRDKRIIKAVQDTAKKAEPKIRDKIPEAFRRLQKQLGVIGTETGARIRDNAPYAAAVEVGSRPHTPPLDPLIDWVLVKGYARDLEEATHIAKRVQRKIQRQGTKPVFYARNSLQQIREILDVMIRAALHEPEDAEASVSTGGGPPTVGGDPSSRSSGKYRQSSTTFRGHTIQTDATGRKFVRYRSGKVHFIDN